MDLRTLPILVLALACAAAAQTARPAATARPRAAASTAAPKLPPELEKAEAAIAQKDFAAAEALLLQETKANPQDFRAWYDLGFVYYQTKRVDQAISAYKRSIALRGDLEQTQSALGLALLDQGRNDEAIPYLRKAAELKPSMMSWMTLGLAQDKDHLQDALQSYARAGELAPKLPDPHLHAASIYERQKDWSAAEREYSAAQTRGDTSASLAGLFRVYRATNRTAEEEAALRAYLKAAPNDDAPRFELGRMLLAQGKNEEAAQEFAAIRARRSDPETLRQLGGLFFAAKDYPQAVEIYRDLAAKAPQDADLHHRLGSALISTKDYAGAEKELIAAANLEPRNPDYLSSLAIAASHNEHYQLVIQALDARAQVAKDTPATLFLRATSYDHLRQYKPAAENYRLFLAAANGAYPDEEWKARHRLIAIDPEEGKKKR